MSCFETNLSFFFYRISMFASVLAVSQTSHVAIVNMALLHWFFTQSHGIQNHSYISRSSLVRIDCKLNCVRYISFVLSPVTLPFYRDLRNAMPQKADAQPHVASTVRTFLKKENIRLLSKTSPSQLLLLLKPVDLGTDFSESMLSNFLKIQSVIISYIIYMSN